jgi:hypothetical protein
MAVAGAASVSIALIPGLAFADPPPALPAAAPEADRAYQPALDYDRDGCYPVPAIGPDGTVNQGLKKGGAENGNCRDASDLDNTNAYSRSKCNNGWCAYMYTLYFEKDQAAAGPGSAGHTHDWEHIVVWVQGDSPKFASASAHGKYETRRQDETPWDGKHPKIVYHKDGGQTHAFRFAKGGGGDEPPENHKGQWQFPALVGWDNYPPGVRDKLVAYNFDAATFGIKDGTFEAELGKAKPADIPFDPRG